MTVVDDPGLAIQSRAFDLGRREGRIETLRAGQPKRARFTASAKQITAANATSEAARIKRISSTTSWHADAWLYYDLLSEVKEGGRFKGRSMSKLRHFPAVRLNPSTDPVALDATNPENDEPYVTNATVISACHAAFDRLTGGVGTSHLSASWGVNGFVAGDAYLVGFEDTSSATGETFMVVASDNVKVTDRGDFALAMSPEAKPAEWLPLPIESSIVTRIWNQHGHWPDLSDSAIHGVLTICEQILVHTYETVAQAQSHMNAGVVIFPNGILSRESVTPDEDMSRSQQGGSENRNPTAQDLVDQLSAPISDPRSTASTIPAFLEADDQLVDKVKHLTFSRPYDSVADQRLDKAITRFANGVDLPREVITGLTDANHWTAWMIDDQTYRSYIEPDAREFTSAVSVGYYRPVVTADVARLGIDEQTVIGVGPDEQPLTIANLCIWHDAASLVGDPDEVENAFKGVEMGLLGNTPARAKIGWSEAEAPTDEDIALRLALTRGREVVGPGGEPVPPAPSDAPGLPAEPATEPPQAPQEPATAAAIGSPTPARFRRLGPAWAKRDAALLARTLHQADAAMTRALDRAGAKLRTKAMRADGGRFADLIHAVPNRQIAASLGPAIVAAALDQPIEDLFEGSFSDLIARFRSGVGRVQATTLAELERLGLDADLVEALAEAQALHAEAASSDLLSGMLRLATDRIFSPHPAAPAAGEHDVELSVPTSLIRETMAKAGGAEGRATPGGAVISLENALFSATGGSPFASDQGEVPLSGVAFGADSLEGLADAGGFVRGMTWDYGDESTRTREFRPHSDLADVPFDAFTDDVLLNPGDWPLVSHFFPGDHDGCQCNVVPNIEGATVELPEGGE